MGEMQERLQSVRATGSAGGGMVKIGINGQMEVQHVTIEKDAVDPDDVGMLEDLVLAAFSDATVKIKEKIREEMSSITGGLNLPPGMLGM